MGASPPAEIPDSRLLKNSANGARVRAGIEENGGMQGRSDPDRKLLDAAALCRQHLVPGMNATAALDFANMIANQHREPSDSVAPDR